MWRVQTDEPCGGVISGWDGRTLRRVSGRTRDGWRGGKAGEWGIGSVIRCSTVRGEGAGAGETAGQGTVGAGADGWRCAPGRRGAQPRI